MTETEFFARASSYYFETVIKKLFSAPLRLGGEKIDFLRRRQIILDKLDANKRIYTE